jgi:ketosteroid isomerase-like protein
MMQTAEQFVRGFLEAIQRDEVVGREQEWFTEDVVQIEWPNKLAPAGATRDLNQLREAGERGRAIVEKQWYEVANVVAADNRVAVEAIFRATFNVDVAGLPKGEVMTANFAMFFEMRDGRIARHHSYDCFTAWKA